MPESAEEGRRPVTQTPRAHLLLKQRWGGWRVRMDKPRETMGHGPPSRG